MALYSISIPSCNYYYLFIFLPIVHQNNRRILEFQNPYLTLILNISKGGTIMALVDSLCALKVWQNWRKHSLIGHCLSEARTKVIIPHYINWGQTETLPAQCLNQPEKREREATQAQKHKSLGIPPFPWHYCVCVDAFCGGCNGREESSVRGWLCNLGVIAPSRPPIPPLSLRYGVTVMSASC